MRYLALAVLLLSLTIHGGVSASNFGKANLGTGVPPDQSQPGATNVSNCANGNSPQYSCGSFIPAGITYATTAHNWSQAVASGTQDLTGGSPGTVLLSPCPAGVDYTSGSGYEVAINDANFEVVSVTSGSISGGKCSISFTPFFSHSSYTIQSASSGIQETINLACGTYRSPNFNTLCNVTIPASGPYSGSGIITLNNYNVYGTIFFHSNESVLNGYGVQLLCVGRGPCLQIGDRTNANDYSSNAVKGLSFRTPTNFSSNPAYAGVRIANTSVISGYATITTASAHNFRPGDLVTILFTDDRSYWGDATVTDCGSGKTPAACTSASTTFRYARSGTIASQNTPGVVALAYEAIFDNANDTHFIDIQNASGSYPVFNNFFDMWDDENATIEHFNNNGISLNHSANWTGSFIFSGGAENVGHQLAPVITLRDSNITANSSNGVTDYNSNGLYIENTVIQASGLWQVNASNTTGNYLGAYLKNVYSESNARLNPLSPPRSPFPGLGIAGLIAGASSGAASFQIAGSGRPEGAFAAGGTGSIPYSYFVVANDITAGTQTSPMQVLNWLSTGSDSIPVRWPRVANGTDAITYDVIRITTPAGFGAVYPYTGGCPGGAGGTCGSVARGLTQSTACSGLVCTYTDNGSSSTTAYTIKQADYNGSLSFWPGSLVSVNKSISEDTEVAGVVGVGLNGNPLQIANQCSNYGVTSAGGYTTCLASVTSANNSVRNQTATLVTDGAEVSSGMTLSKGRLNFSTTPGAILNAHHVITLIDSQPALTQATSGYRPPASANDTWIGTDLPSSGAGLSKGQLAFGAPVSITNYIHATGDGVHSNWLERLTDKQKIFAVPVMIKEGNSLTLGDGSPLSQMKIYSLTSMPVSHVPPQSCVDVVGQAKGLTRSDQITGITPPQRLGNLSLNAYPADEGTIVLHFCNPSTSEVVTPSGAYSFLAVR